MNTGNTPAIYGWHFIGEYSRNADPIGEVRRETKAEVGAFGLHFSPCALVALRFARGFDLQRVRATGTIDTGGGDLGGACNHAATEREALATLPASTVRQAVIDFAFWCVEEVARPAAIKALRDAGREDKAATLEALPPVVDTESAKAFRAAARAARAAADAATYAAYAAADAADAAVAAVAAVAANAAADAAYAAAYAANAADYAAARERIAAHLNNALSEALAEHCGYNINSEGK